MDNKSLQFLNKLFDGKINPVNVDTQNIKSSQVKIENKLDVIVEQTADTKFMTETKVKLTIIISDVAKIKNDINSVKIDTSKKWNWNEIAKLKPAK